MAIWLVRPRRAPREGEIQAKGALDEKVRATQDGYSGPDGEAPYKSDIKVEEQEEAGYKEPSIEDESPWKLGGVFRFALWGIDRLIFGTGGQSTLNKDGDPRIAVLKAEIPVLYEQFPRVRRADWRSKPREVTSMGRLRGAFVQQTGRIALSGKECHSCGANRGPFKSCRILVDGRGVLFAGACGNCGFNAAGHRCSFRDSVWYPKWAREYLRKVYPNHPLVREAQKVSGRSLSVSVVCD